MENNTSYFHRYLEFNVPNPTICPLIKWLPRRLTEKKNQFSPLGRILATPQLSTLGSKNILLLRRILLHEDALHCQGLSHCVDWYEGTSWGSTSLFWMDSKYIFVSRKIFAFMRQN
jgi:hypothetical protein